MRAEPIWILAYDVGSNRRRERIARRLEQVGTRVQRSVFLLPARRRVIRALLDELQSDIGRLDRIQAWRLASDQETEGMCVGEARDPLPICAILMGDGVETVGRRGRPHGRRPGGPRVDFELEEQG